MPRLIVHGFTISLDGYGAGRPNRACHGLSMFLRVMRSLLLSILCVNGLSVTAANPAWVKLDKQLIDAVVRLDLSNATAVEKYFIEQARSEHQVDAENLGFGWSMKRITAPGGYISIWGEFFRQQDSIVAFRVIPQMPDEPELLAKYMTWYMPVFTFDGDRIQAYQYRTETLHQPLPGYPGKVDVESDSLLEYMTPFSHTTYGVRGTSSNALLPNRRFFRSIEGQVNDSALVLMMYAVNPASRLTAIEYYYRRGHKPGENVLVDAWIERVFLELPEVFTLSGCIGHLDNARELVTRMVSEPYYGDE